MRSARNSLLALTFIIFFMDGAALQTAGAGSHRATLPLDCGPCGHPSFYPAAGPFGSIFDRALPASGWELLKAGRAGEALHRFGAAARANPSNGIPKVGFSLAAAHLGHLGEAVWVMRRALVVDPESLDQVDGKTNLRSKMEEVIRSYQQTDLYRTGDTDVYFMIAALFYLLDDLEASKKHADRAGDGTASTRNLYRLIEARVAAHRSPAARIA